MAGQVLTLETARKRKYCRLIELAIERQQRDLVELPKTGLYRFNTEEVQRYEDFCRTFLRHSDGRWARQPFELADYQREHLAGPLLGWQKWDEETGKWVRRFRKAYIQLTKKSGKMLDLNTPVPIPGGWSTMGDLKVGDEVFDEKGNVCKVTALSDIDLMPESYLMTFSNGEQIKACADHQWVTTYWGQAESTKTTKQIFNSQHDFHTIYSFQGGFLIKEVTPCESVPMRCISVDSPSHQFLVGKTMIPTHNSAWVSSLGAYMLIADGEHGAQCFSAATGLKQAGLVHGSAKRMLSTSVKNGPLKKHLNIVSNCIAFPATMSSWRPVTGDADSNDGIIPHFVSADEYHRWADRELMDVLEKGMVTGDQPMLVIITTAGSSFISPCYQERTYAQKVLEQEYSDETYFAYIAEPDITDDWRDPEVHRQVNPSLGITIKESAFQEEFKKALQSKSAELSFKRFHLNMWTEVENHWLDLEKWRSVPLSFWPEALKGKKCWVGVDLSSIIDITAVSLVFPLWDDYFAILPFFFVPRENIDSRTLSDGVPYRRWLEEGKIRATAGNVIDYKAVRQLINELGQIYDIQEIAIDRWNSTQLAVQLAEEDGFIVESMGQGYKSLSDPAKHFEAAVLAKKALHNNNEVLSWMASNCAVQTDSAGNIKPDKKHSREKVDGIFATLNAVGRMLLHLEKTPSKYEQIGVVRI